VKPAFFVGSLPFLNVPAAIEFVQKESAHLPFLPQLPELNPQEDMIGQVLRGFELGFWDEQASCALELFQNTFCESPGFKIQIAGPNTIARTLSLPFENIAPQWVTLVQGLHQQLRQGSFTGELWIQIDEPYLPHKGTAYLLAELQPKLNRTVFGLHSCATVRPEADPELWAALRFMAFDCSKTPVSEAEKRLWDQWLQEDSRRVLAWGQPLNQPIEDAWALAQPQVWRSAPCGLYGQRLY